MGEAVKSFIKGMGQAIDLGGTMAPQRPRVSPEVAAQMAVARAFESTGRHIRAAMAQEQPNAPITTPTE